MSKLNYLVVMPCFIQNTANELIFPLGIAYVSASMKKTGFNTYTLNLNHYSSNDAEYILREKILSNNIDVVLLGGLSFQYSIIKNIVDIVKYIKSTIKIIVGGGIITGDPVPAMQALESVDFGIIGEGEVTVCELCYELENNQVFDRVLGIIYRNEHNVLIKNSERSDIEDLDSLPLPDYEGFEYEKHLNTTRDKESNNIRRNFNSIYIIGSRSCPYNCTFCFHTSGKRYRQRSLDSIFAELDYLVNKYEIDYISIQDELFSHQRERIEEFCRRIKKYNIGWWAQFRVDALDEDIVRLVKESGCNQIGLGLESADDRILKSMRKGITIKKIEHALKIIYNAQIPFVGTFIFGDKEETFETANNTLNWWKRHTEYRIDLRLITVYPGSTLYRYALEKGIIKDTVEFLKNGCPQINVSKMNDNEFGNLTKEIIELPLKNAVEFTGYSYKNNVLTAQCVKCGYENIYKDIVFFTGSYLACNNCGQKHNTTTFPEVLELLDKNIGKLVEKYNNIAIWSINYYIGELFNKLPILHRSNTFAIDISTTKQNMRLADKNINHPDILLKENIKVVIVGVSSYKNQIKAQIQQMYKCVEEVIDINELIKEDY